MEGRALEYTGATPPRNAIGRSPGRAGAGETVAQKSERDTQGRPRLERGLLVGVEQKGPTQPDWPLETSLKELAQLARTAGIEVAGRVVQRLDAFNSATLIGRGKVEEVRGWILEEAPDLVLFDEELSPHQQRNLERALDVRVVDRTALILDIFAQHARTREGRLQVELAQYEYRLPRLTRMWTHLARQVGGGGGRGGRAGVGLRGPGETQLETDRREIRRRIGTLRRELDQVRTHRALHRRRRRRSGVSVVAIVGYTNAGKSTLLNAVSGAEVLVEEQLFATLDPTTRRVSLPDGRAALFTDTVGFIQKLPTELVASFRATLEEITDAELLVHILDITQDHLTQRLEVVEGILEELGAGRIPRVLVLNKIDLVTDEQGEGMEERIREFSERFPLAVAVSAQAGTGLDRLLERVAEVLAADMVRLRVLLPYGKDGLLHLFHERGVIQSEDFTEAGVRVVGRLPRQLRAEFAAYAEEAS